MRLFFNSLCWFCYSSPSSECRLLRIWLAGGWVALRWTFPGDNYSFCLVVVVSTFVPLQMMWNEVNQHNDTHIITNNSCSQLCRRVALFKLCLWALACAKGFCSPSTVCVRFVLLLGFLCVVIKRVRNWHCLLFAVVLLGINDEEE